MSGVTTSAIERNRTAFFMGLLRLWEADAMPIMSLAQCFRGGCIMALQPYLLG
jgi:hypothetical protein